MADNGKSEDKGKSKDSFRPVSSRVSFTELLWKEYEKLGRLNFSKFVDPSLEAYNYSSSLSSYFEKLPKVTLTDELLENRLDWSKSITDISTNVTTWFEERSKFWQSDFSDLDKVWKDHLEAIDVTPLNESADKAAEALTGDPEKPYTKKEAKAALPKLVEFAKQYDEVTEAIVTLTVKTKSGGQAMTSVKMTREQMMSDMDLDRVLVNGEPMMIALPKSLNQPKNAQLALVDVNHPTAALPPPKEDLVPLGSYARRFIDKADRMTHTITFKKGQPLKMRPDRTIAWQLVEYLLTEGELKNGGWLTRPPELQGKKLSAEFRVPIPSPLGKGTMTDPNDDMTRVWHHIQQTAKSGRPGLNAQEPKFRFFHHINHKTYDKVVKAYEDALAEKKRRATAENNGK